MYLSQLITIVRRKDAERYLDFLAKHSIHTQYMTLCEGTARAETLSLLGLEPHEKTLINAFITGEKRAEILTGLIREMQIDLPGNGIALTIPLESVGGTASLHHLTAGQSSENKEEKKPMEENKYSLIVIIAERGSTDMVMDAARKVGARGGTVIPAKGTGAAFASKFFGISIGEEKEMIYIVAKKQEKNDILKAVLSECGPSSSAHAVAFSLPVDSVVGLRTLESEG